MFEEDFGVLCDRVLPYVEKMRIDESKVDTLANFSPKKQGQPAKTSDHNSIFVNFNINVRPEKIERKEVYVFHDEEAMKRFKEETTKTKKLSSCFNSNESFDKQVEKWMKTLKSFINKTFRKVRICDKTKKKEDNGEIGKLLAERREAMREGNGVLQEELESMVKKKEAEQNFKQMERHIREMNADPNNRNNNI